MPAGSQWPFTGSPLAIPGTIQAEDFDGGGEGAAYHDASRGNDGNAYRATDVDIEATEDAGAGWNVGWAEPVHILRLSLDAQGPSGTIGNFNWIRFTLESP
jgi:hypothetical protein